MVLATNIAFADYAYSPVLVGVGSSYAFSVTLNGQSATNSATAAPGTATGTIWFNATGPTITNINASVAGASSQVGAYPACGTPIAVFKNLGNTVQRLSIYLNNTITGAEFFYNASMKAGSTTGTPNTTINEFNGAGSAFVTGLGLNNETNLCIWANTSSMSSGTYYTWFNYTSA